MIDNEQRFRAYADERGENILWRAHRLAERHTGEDLDIRGIVSNAIRLSLASQGMLYRFTEEMVDDFMGLPWDRAIRSVWGEHRRIEVVR